MPRIDARTIYLYSFVIGCLTGLTALLFHTGIHSLTHWLFDRLAQFPLEQSPSFLDNFSLTSLSPRHLWVLLIPATGGLLVGLVSHSLDPAAEGSGIDHLLESFHRQGGEVRKRTPLLKFLTATLTIASGGSAGKEGPMALIGAGIGSLSGNLIKMGARARRTLLLAGAAGGLGAVFRAPLGGAITAVEVLYKEDFESDALLPCIISSVTAYTLFSAVLGFGHNIRFAAPLFHTPLELIFFALLGFVCAGAGYLFIQLFRALPRYGFDKLPLPKIWKPAVGGLLIGIIGLLFPKAIGEGLGVIQWLLDGGYPQTLGAALLFLLGLAALKMLATTFTIGSGGSGGLLIPSLFIGATLGAAFGNVAHHFFPELVPSATPYMVVGMAAFFAAVTNASLGALVIVTEMTGGYELLPPLMIVAVISLITSRKWTIYKNQVTNKFASQAHSWNMNPVILQHATVRQLFDQGYPTEAIIENRSSLTAVEQRTEETQHTDYIVVNAAKELVGLFSLRDLSAMGEEVKAAKGHLIVADVMGRKLFYVEEESALFEALRCLMDSDFDKVPVIRKAGKALTLLGYLQQGDILKYYYKTALRQELKKPEGP